MTRLTMLLVAFLCLVPAASAGLNPRQQDKRFETLFPVKVAREAPPPEEKAELVITAETEVKLDGHTCKYEDVPKSADIILLDVSADKKLIRKIHFRSKK
jgi:hypothetical protein